MTDRHEVLERWRAQEAAIRARAPSPGVSSPDALKSLSGLEFLGRIIAGTLPPPPIAETLDFLLIEAERGRIVFQSHPHKRHYNPLGSVHGGYFCTLLDSALGCAVHSMLPAGTGYTTLELKVNLVRPLTDRTGLIRAEGHVVHVGKSTGIAEGRIVDAEGKLYAHATTTCLIFAL